MGKTLCAFIFGLLFSSSFWVFFVFGEGNLKNGLVFFPIASSAILTIVITVFILDNWNN